MPRWLAGGAAFPESHVTQTIAMLRRVAAAAPAGPLAAGRSGAGGRADCVRTPEAITQLLREAAATDGRYGSRTSTPRAGSSRRTVHPTLVSGGFMLGLDDESGERRTFVISRIQEGRARPERGSARLSGPDARPCYRAVTQQV